ncbi:phosphoadenylyl-sulfate reductase [Glutamicibacter sp. NPDC087344]|uniref:phosphoadenylyl-sulfate reductase n=1 Tax=Glutamicibacter sp. NPDC087344 TaxID=3363994 RepID=UPI0038225ACF
MSTKTSTSKTENELRAIAARGAEELGWDATAAQVVEFAARHLDVKEIAVACSMADAVLPHLVAQQLPGVDVLFLDTGYHFTETRITRDEVAGTLPVNVVDVLPTLSVAQQDEQFGKDLFSRDAAACCKLRKMDPLKEALSGYSAWFTGVRRDEAPTRINTPLVTYDEVHGLIKFNPVAPWSFDELINYASTHQVPVNMLLAHGYPSIGCAPCTRPVAAGEDPRAGRWAGLSKTECGIHI